MNSQSSKISDPHRLLLNISDLIFDISFVFLMNHIQYQIFRNILSISSKYMKQRLVIVQEEYM